MAGSQRRLERRGWITSAEAREFGQDLRRQLDAILVGVGTILADDPAANLSGAGRERSAAGPDGSRQPAPDADSTPVCFEMAAPLVIFCRPEAPSRPRRLLEKAGAEVISVPRVTGGLDLEPVIAELARRKVLGLLVEGGSEIHWSFISRQLTDKFYFILAPARAGRQTIGSVDRRRGIQDDRERAPIQDHSKFSGRFRPGSGGLSAIFALYGFALACFRNSSIRRARFFARIKPEITAALAAPASSTALTWSSPIPPIATTGLGERLQTRLSRVRPTTLAGSVFVAVAKTGPNPM